MARILRSCFARSAIRRCYDTVARRQFAAAAAVWEDDDLDYWTDCEEKAHVPLAEDTCCERGPRGVQWVFMGGPGVQKHLYAARMAQLLDVPYISMGTLVRQELDPRSSIYLKVCLSIDFFCSKFIDVLWNISVQKLLYDI
jgi:adenylate kinase